MVWNEPLVVILNAVKDLLFVHERPVRDSHGPLALKQSDLCHLRNLRFLMVFPDPRTAAQDVLDFWFGLDKPGQKDDPAVRAVLGPAYEQAAAHKLDAWAEQPRERLALILLLDQVPRHLYREDGRAYATDRKAQGLAQRFLDREDWLGFHSIEHYYAVLPYLHAEDVAKQQRVNPHIHRITASIPGLEFMGRIADLYLDTIRRFGYFPHRHRLRGIPLTAEEERFLKEEWEPRRRRVLPDRLAEREAVKN